MIFAFLVKTPFYDDILRGKFSGGLYNGYVGFSDNLPESYQSGGSGDLDYLIDVHGGITFDRNVDFSKSWKSERIPIPLGDSEIPTSGVYRVVGFDTLHCNDTMELWDFEHTRKETEYLMSQIAKLIAANKLKKLKG